MLLTKVNKLYKSLNNKEMISVLFVNKLLLLFTAKILDKTFPHN